MPLLIMLHRMERSLFAGRRNIMMDALERAADDTRDAINHSGIAKSDLAFLPANLVTQCRMLIESFHELHGYSCLPDILWKARLGPFIETHRELRELLKKASTTRSAKKSNEGFVKIASTILSLEILVSQFAGWSAIYPQAASAAQAMLKRNAGNSHMPLIEFYLYPPKYPNAATIATLAPPPNLHEADSFSLL